MTRVKLDSVLLLILGSVLFLWAGISWERTSLGSMVDFKAVFYASKCLIQNVDPYNPLEFLKVYEADGGIFPSDRRVALSLHRSIPICINLPPVLLLMAPLAVFPFGPAHVIWMLLIAGGFIFATCLMWNLGAGHAPLIAALLACIFLASSESLLEEGNTAGIVISLCAIAVWCFLRERFIPAGILCLAIGLIVKPHDAGLVWLYFLLAGGVHRKRALLALAVGAVLSLPGVLWVYHVAPNWPGELHSNVQATSVRGDINDPGPASLDARYHGAIMVSLQTAISIFKDDPMFYNPISYLLSLPLLFAWALRVSRSTFTTSGAYLAIAAASALTMLPIYHRQYDTRMLILTIPACAMLWAGRGALAKAALLVTLTGAVLTDNTVLQIIGLLTFHVREAATGLSGKMLNLFLARPAPLALLIVGTFFLWVYSAHNYAWSGLKMRWELCK